MIEIPVGLVSHPVDAEGAGPPYARSLLAPFHKATQGEAS